MRDRVVIEPGAARELWRSFEPVHAVVYFAPEVRAAYNGVGLRGFWMGYFAGRSAALGAASPQLVHSTFFNFSPAFVGRSIPDAWSFATPADVLGARLHGVDAALRRLWGEACSSAEVEEAAAIVLDAAGACAAEGRPLFAAHTTLDVPEPAHLRLWHAATLLREHRGDGHVAALVAEGLGGLDAHQLMCADAGVPRELMQGARGWSDEQWEATQRALMDRGLLDGDGALTPAGRATRERVEATTDRLAAAPWRTLDASRHDRLRELLAPLSSAAAGEIPFPNPMGLPAPD